MVGNINKLGSIVGKGLISQGAPGIVKGALIESLKSQRINVQGATEWVERDVRLWDTFKETQKAGLVRLRRLGGEFDWLTTEWVIESIKGELPSVASLFLGWKKANNWLSRQVDMIKLKAEE